MKIDKKLAGGRKKLQVQAVTAAVNATPTTLLAQDGDLEEIQVTGTRIRTTDGMAEPTPVG